MRRLLTLALAGALGVAAIGCSSSSDDADKADKDDKATTTTEATDEAEDEGEDEGPEGDTVAYDDWVDEVNGICVDTNDNLDALGEPTDIDEVIEMTSEANDIITAGVDEITELGLPDEMTDEAEEWIGLLEDRVEMTEDLLSDLEDLEDPTEEEIDELFTDFGEQADAAELETDALAEELGLDDCVSDDSEDVTDDTEAEDDSTDDTDVEDDIGVGDDLELLPDDLSAGSLEEVEAALVAAGLTAEEATCVAEGLEPYLDDPTLDPSDPTGPVFDVILGCVPTERLMELSESGL